MAMLRNKQEKIICKRCGKCCLAHLIVYLNDDDIDRWKREKRDDILHIIEHNLPVWAGDHLISAGNGRYLYCCPFFEWQGKSGRCSIYETRPRVCREYLPGSSALCSQFKLK